MGRRLDAPDEGPFSHACINREFDTALFLGAFDALGQHASSLLAIARGYRRQEVELDPVHLGVLLELADVGDSHVNGLACWDVAQVRLEQVRALRMLLGQTGRFAPRQRVLICLPRLAFRLDDAVQRPGPDPAGKPHHADSLVGGEPVAASADARLRRLVGERLLQRGSGSRGHDGGLRLQLHLGEMAFHCPPVNSTVIAAAAHVCHAEREVENESSV